MSSKVIKLSTPVEAFNQTFMEIELREPRAGEYIEFGEPRIYARTQEGSIYAVEDNGVIKKYLSRCIARPTAAECPAIESLLSFADIRRVKSELLSFFDGAPAT
jgi:hypothetical protein